MNTPNAPKDVEVVLVDGFGKPTGRVGRNAAHAGEGRLHLAFTVVLLDSKGQVVLGRRSPTKMLWARSYDATVASHPLPGEEPLDAAARRLQEELGVQADLEAHGSFRYHARDRVPGGFLRGSEKEHCLLFLGRAKGPLKPNPAEIDDLRAASPQDVIHSWTRDPRGVCPWAPLALLGLRKVLTAEPATWTALERAVGVWPDLERLP